MTVRLATREDEEDLMNLCRELWEENGMFSMSDDLVRMMLHRAFSKQGGIIGVIGEKGKLEGCISIILGTLWYSTEWHLEELFNYVRPQFRKSDRAKQLIQFAKKMSDEVGIPLIIGVISNERTEAKVRLYERQLHKPAGAFFVYKGNGVAV